MWAHNSKTVLRELSRRTSALGRTWGELSCGNGASASLLANRMETASAQCDCATSDGMRAMHCGPTSSAKQHEIEGANQVGQTKGDHKEGAGFMYQPNESHPSQQSPTLSHPQAGQTGTLSHIDKDGNAAMVDVSRFVSSQREAVASAKVALGPDVFKLVAANGMKKGDVLKVAQLAGIMGAKQCSALVPLCHNILISFVDVKLRLEESSHSVHITAEAHTNGPTGVEMEALTAASVAALTIFDMCKAVSRQLVISDLRLERKTGGKSGTFDRTAGVGY